MAEVTYFVALPFIAIRRRHCGRRAYRMLQPCSGCDAEALKRKDGHVGAVAFSRTGDPATGDFHDATVLRKFGDVPDDLRAL